MGTVAYFPFVGAAIIAAGKKMRDEAFALLSERHRQVFSSEQGAMAESGFDLAIGAFDELANLNDGASVKTAVQEVIYEMRNFTQPQLRFSYKALSELANLIESTRGSDVGTLYLAIATSVWFPVPHGKSELMNLVALLKYKHMDLFEEGAPAIVFKQSHVACTMSGFESVADTAKIVIYFEKGKEIQVLRAHAGGRDWSFQEVEDFLIEGELPSDVEALGEPATVLVHGQGWRDELLIRRRLAMCKRDL